MINDSFHIINLITGTWFRFMGQQILISFIIFCIVLVLILLIRKKSLWLQAGLWSLVFLKLIIPANIGTGLNEELEYVTTLLSNDQITETPSYGPFSNSEIVNKNKIDSNLPKIQNEKNILFMIRHKKAILPE